MRGRTNAGQGRGARQALGDGLPREAGAHDGERLGWEVSSQKTDAP